MVKIIWNNRSYPIHVCFDKHWEAPVLYSQEPGHHEILQGTHFTNVD